MDNRKSEQQRKGRERELPPIRVDDKVSDDEPQVKVGRRRASLPPPIETPSGD